ncbi:MAG: NADPH-dependent assimilatory sulfite reductase hemoprotein subunit [Balneolaceae bacterium]
MADKKTNKKSKVEKVKEASNYLRAPVAEELLDDEPKFSRESYEILKFHGSYQQDDRDLRQGRNKHWMFMVRGRMPGGKLTADQYLAIEKIADQFGDGTVRVTTRQAFQLYGIVKNNLKETIRHINDSMITTLGACGDVVRNVMATPAPDVDGRQEKVQAMADELSDILLPSTRAYHETWLNGEKVYSGKDENGKENNDVPEETEPLYGKNYLPRKFKIGLTIPGDNSIDLYTQDIGLVALFDDRNEIEGFNVIVGGGLGMNHKKADTYPRLGDHLGYVTADKVIPFVKGIIKVQRDLGNRENRKQARMKYLIDKIGLDSFRQELLERTGFEPEPYRELPKFEPDLYLGWNRQSDNNWFLGVSIENGRIKDDEDLQLKTALKKVAELFQPGVRFTPNHNVLLTDIEESDKEAVEKVLRDHGVLPGDKLSNLLKYSMACPALPTCGLAITESERIFPDVIRELEQVVEEMDLQDEKISLRMTGCPNGCARPYVADIGFVGRSLDKYTLFLGGNPAGTRLGKVYKDLVPLNEIVDEVRVLLTHFKDQRRNGEQFGDFWARTGVEEARKLTINA